MNISVVYMFVYGFIKVKLDVVGCESVFEVFSWGFGRIFEVWGCIFECWVCICIGYILFVCG